MRRVVITGLGILTPLGVGVEYNWKSLINGESGLRKITHFDTDDLNVKIAGMVPRGDEEHEFNPDNVLSSKEQRKVSDFIIYAMEAADQAIKDSGWTPQDELSLDRTGVMVGAGIGGLGGIYQSSITLYEKGAKRISPFFIPSSLINLASGHISMKYGFSGPNHSVVTACATGTHAIGDAARIIKYNDADVMIAGGTEAAVSKVGMAGFASAKALSTSFNDEPSRASRPWDEARDGFVMGEGAGVVVLEEYEHAKKRGAKIYAEVIGYGMSGDAYHITSPHPEGKGAYNAMKNAISDAKIDISDIEYINAHGTSTPVGDATELKTVKRLFSNHAENILMSSTKSSIGHLLGAAGSTEAIFSTLALRDSVIPATLNLDNSIDSLGIDLVANQVKEKKISTILSNSFGFGGTNASLIIRTI